MARSAEEIFNSMVAERQTLAELAALLPNYNLPPLGSDNPFLLLLKEISSSSATAIWRLELYIAAQAAAEQEQLWDSFQTTVQAILDSQRPAVKDWYRTEALKFQDNYELFWNGEKWMYLADDPAARIIAQCSVIELPNGQLRIKVAKDDGSGNLVALSGAQLARFNAYMQKIKYAGTNLTCVSFSADTINTLFNFKYDAMLVLDDLKLAAKAAIKNYLKSLRFDGAVNLNAIIDALQAVPGIVDAVPVAFQAKYGALPYSNYLAQGEYATNAGYAILDEAIFDTANWAA